MGNNDFIDITMPVLFPGCIHAENMPGSWFPCAGMRRFLSNFPAHVDRSLL